MRTGFNVRRLILGTALLGIAVAPAAVRAQSTLDVSEAQAFLGAWVIAMQTDLGPISVTLEVVDQDGKVAARIGSPEMGPEMLSITDISKEGESLVMMWEMDAQGTFLDVSMTLEPDGENLSAWFETGGGEFSAGGVATRK